MKTILVRIDNRPTFNMSVTRKTKIGHIRDVINKYLEGHGMSPAQYQIEMNINPTTKLNVFNTFKWDNMTLESVFDNIKNGQILVINFVSLLEKLPRDIVRKIGLNLSPKDVLALCLTNKYFNDTVCESKTFWRNKLQEDYPTRILPIQIYRDDPKLLYLLLSERSKIVEIVEEDYPELAAADISDRIEEEEISAAAKLITKAFEKKKPKGLFLRKGDVIHLGWGSTYRNDDKFMWDGEKVVALDYDIDEYGSVSQEFAFPEFRPDYFLDSIDHNSIVRFTPGKRQEIMDNFDPETQTSFVTDKYNKYIVKLHEDYENIKFEKIFVDDNSYLEVEYDGKDIIFHLPFRGSSFGTGRHFVSKITMPTKWKDAVITIDEIDYEWKGNELTIDEIDYEWKGN